MPNDTASATPLADLCEVENFQLSHAAVFPSAASVRWFYRRHRAELLEAGAVVELAGRLLIHAPVFEQKALEIGRRMAAAR